METEKCNHKDIKVKSILFNTHLCIECGENLVSHEIEIFNSYYEIGGFCNNKDCKRFLLLTV